MNRLRSVTTGLGLLLALTLVSCSTVSTETINDQLPTGTQNNPPATTPPGTTPITTPPMTEAITLSSGTLAQIAPGHPTSGTAKLIKLTDGSYVIRLENLSTVGGPDVRIWASEGSDLSNSGTVGASAYTDLGKIKSTNGNQNYDLKLSAEQVGKIKSVVIWCQSFSVAFGGAVLK
jgi:Electron transfer DM13